MLTVAFRRQSLILFSKHTQRVLVATTKRSVPITVMDNREKEPLKLDAVTVETDEKNVSCGVSYGTPTNAVSSSADEQFIYSDDGTTVVGKIVSTVAPLGGNDGVCCWYCRSNDHPESLYQPCHCSSYIHRGCFRQWRTGWINPKNYFSCPNCMFSYNIERVRPATTESKQRIFRHYQFAIAKLWISVLLIACAVVAAFAGISYGADRSHKRIPVAVKYLLTSVVNGFPTAQNTHDWAENFKQPDVAVWPYYTLFGILISSVLILICFAFMGCSFDEEERRRRGNCRCCEDCADCCAAPCGNTYWNCYYVDCCPHHHYYGGSNRASGTCACCDCNVDCNNGGCSGPCGDCKGCSGGGGGSCDGDAGAIIAVILIILIVAIILSALVVAVIFIIQKGSLLYDRMTDMLDHQQSELEGETVVLGINESWRPINEV